MPKGLNKYITLLYLIFKELANLDWFELRKLEVDRIKTQKI